MGLYIPDVRLPADNDFELWIAVKKDGSFTYNVRGGWQDGKQKVVLVLEPHGRLIDTESGTFPTLHRNPTNDYMHGWNTCLKSVLQQPTIIPASAEVST